MINYPCSDDLANPSFHGEEDRRSTWFDVIMIELMKCVDNVR